MNTKTKAWTEMTTEEQLAKAVAEVERLQKMLHETETRAEKDKDDAIVQGSCEILRGFATGEFFDAIENEDKDKVFNAMKKFMHLMRIEPYGKAKGEIFMINEYNINDYLYANAWKRSDTNKKVEVVYQGYKTRSNVFNWKPFVNDVVD